MGTLENAVKLFTKGLVTCNNPLKKYHQNPENAIISQDKQRALNIGAILTETNNEFYDSLQAAKHGAAGYQKALLSKWWGISSPESAPAILEWLKNKGHRRIFGIILENQATTIDREPSFKDFRLACEQADLPVIDENTREKYVREVGLVENHLDILHSIHTRMPDDEIDRLIKEQKIMFYDVETFEFCIKIYRAVSKKYNKYAKYAANLRQSLQKLQKYGFADTDAGFYRINPAAWDMGRLVNVARWCFGSGYITENQAWEYIFYAEKESSNCYTNWASFGNAYVICRALWGGESDLLENTVLAADGLLKDENSPWKLTPLL